MAHAARRQVLQYRPLDAYLAGGHRLGTDVGHHQFESGAVQVFFDLIRLGTCAGVRTLAAGGYLLQTSFHHLVAPRRRDETPIVDGVGDVIGKRRMGVVEHHARKQVDELQVAQQLVLRTHATGQGVVAVVVMMSYVHGAVVGVAGVGQGGQEAGCQARVAQQLPPIERRVAAVGGQPVVGVQVARQHLQDVVADGTEHAERQRCNAVLTGEAGGAVDDAEQVMLVAVTDAGHGQAGVGTALVEGCGGLIVENQRHRSAETHGAGERRRHWSAQWPASEPMRSLERLRFTRVLSKALIHGATVPGVAQAVTVARFLADAGIFLYQMRDPLRALWHTPRPGVTGMQRYLVTGAAGNLARQLLTELGRRRNETLGIDLAPAPDRYRGDWRQVDITDRASLAKLIAEFRPECILHMASLLSMSSAADPRRAWTVNASAAVALMELATEHRVQRFFFPSTSATYGGALPDPLPEDHPQWPDNIYGATKVAVERVGTYFALSRGLDFRSVRLPIVASPFAPAAAVSAYASHVFRARRQWRAVHLPGGSGSRRVGDLRARCDPGHPASDNRSRATPFAARLQPAWIRWPAPAIWRKRLRSACPVSATASIPTRWPWRSSLCNPQSTRMPAPRRDWGWHPRFDLAAAAEDLLGLMSAQPGEDVSKQVAVANALT